MRPSAARTTANTSAYPTSAAISRSNAISTSIPTSPTDRCGPSARVNEAWNDGLDAIAMTDHIEVHKNADIIRCGLNKPYELAKARGDMIGMIVIPGAEITRKKPLGHICTLFIRDADKLDVEDEMQAVEEACRQGAFLLWNHPGYPDRKSDIYPVHERLIAQGKLRGVEVFNKTESYPRTFDYAVQYGLVPFANSDIHYMSGSIYPVRGSRPMTLVFATARTAGAIHEALLAGRALACFDGNLMGRGEYIGQMIDAALEIREIRQASKTKRTFEIANKSDLRFAVRPASYDYPMPVYAGQVLRIDITQGEEVEFTNCILGKGRYYTRIFWE